ncbi:MAG: nucleotidyltransferase family protein [Waterburya sp.]
MLKVGLIILAAGASARMGTPKQLLPYRGRSLVRHAAETVLASICCPVIIVLGANAEQIQPELEQLSVHIVKNPQWHLGMGASIRSGIETIMKIEPKLDAVVISLADMPLISTNHINNLVERYEQQSCPVIVASAYRATIGVPTLFDRSIFWALTNLQGKAGAKSIIKKYANSMSLLATTEANLDIDTPDDYKNLQVQRK